MTPGTYDEWRHCIEVKCGLQLTPEFVQQRLSALRDDRAFQTQRFREMWGDEHLRQVITWFEKAENKR
ncbi:MAG: hypothetical protein ACR2Q4_12285 [Geminicoccaceae bacterium]